MGFEAPCTQTVSLTATIRQTGELFTDGVVYRAMILSDSITVVHPECAEEVLLAKQECHPLWMLWTAMQRCVAAQALHFGGYIDECVDSELSAGFTIGHGGVVAIDHESCPLARQLARRLESFVAVVAAQALQGSRAPVCVRPLLSEQQIELWKRFSKVSTLVLIAVLDLHSLVRMQVLQPLCSSDCVMQDELARSAFVSHLLYPRMPAQNHVTALCTSSMPGASNPMAFCSAPRNSYRHGFP